jgi:DNA mismatch repair protein MutS
MARVQNASMEIKEWKGDLVFLRNLVLRPAESSYGIHVAKMAGLPKKVLDRANRLLQDRLRHQDQLSLFTQGKKEEEDKNKSMLSPQEFELLKAIRKMDFEDLSPRGAWTFLESWFQKLRSDP